MDDLDRSPAVPFNYQFNGPSVGWVRVLNGTVGVVTVQTVASSTYTFDVNSIQTYLRFSNACTATIPPNASVPLSVGSQLSMEQASSGQLSVVGGAGVTLLPASPIKTVGQNSVIGFIKIATDTWVGYGEKS